MVLRFCATAWLPEAAAAQKTAATEKAADIESRRTQLLSLFDEEWQYELRLRPGDGDVAGDNRYNDRLSDRSPRFYQSDLEAKRKFLARFEAIDPPAFSPKMRSAANYDPKPATGYRRARNSSPGKCRSTRWTALHLSLLELLGADAFQRCEGLRQLPFAPASDSQDVDQVTANMRQGMKDRLMPPRYLLEKVAAQTQEIADTGADASPFAQPVCKLSRRIFPTPIRSGCDRRCWLQSRAKFCPPTSVLPRLCATSTRHMAAPRPGVWALPDGAERYRYQIRRMTTTDLTPEEIHQIGLKQLAETEAEMLALAHKLGFNDLASLNEHIKNDRKFYATSGQQVLDLYAKYTRQMEAQLPKLFGRLPQNKLEVIPMDPFRAKNAVPADYNAGAQDGSRPGHINVNEWDPEHRLTLNIEAIAYHEGVPGHHLQISIGQELKDLPAFRKNGEYTAFVEGWALYSERLGKEIGFYRTRTATTARLENEMWRDIRLVIDTGVHEKHWSRDQMVDFFHRYTAMDEPNVQSEVDRYIAWPGQALAYKLGQLEILRLRDEARQKLGDKFDLRAFHDEVVGNGPLPLGVLHSQVESWIARRKRGRVPSAAAYFKRCFAGPGRAGGARSSTRLRPDCLARYKA